MSLDRLQVNDTSIRHVSFSLPAEKDQSDKFVSRSSFPEMSSLDRKRFSSKSSNRNIPKNKNSLDRRTEKTKVNSSKDISLPNRENISPIASREIIKVSTSRESARGSTSKESTRASTSKESARASTSKESTRASTSKESARASTKRENDTATTSRENSRASTSREITRASTSREITRASGTLENIKSSARRESDKSSGKGLHANNKKDSGTLDRSLESIRVEDVHKASSDEEEYTSDGSFTSYESPDEKMPKKKWMIKLPWGKKPKQEDIPSIESLYSTDSEETYPKPKRKGEEGTSSSEDEKDDIENVSKSMDVLNYPYKSSKPKKKRAFSWYNSKPNKKFDNESSYSDSSLSSTGMKKARSSVDILPDHNKEYKIENKNKKQRKQNFPYSSSSETSIPKLEKPSKRIKKKSKQTYPEDLSQSHPDLLDTASTSEGQIMNKQLSDKESMDSLNFERISSKRQSGSINRFEDEPQIKKSNSLPSIFFKRNKKKTEEAPKQNYVQIIEPCLNSFSEDESSIESIEDKFTHDKNKLYKEAPLANVRSEKPPLKTIAKNSSTKDLGSNVESVNSIFKRMSYERVYPSQDIKSSLSYPRKQNEKTLTDSTSSLPSKSKKSSYTHIPESNIKKVTEKGKSSIQKRNSTEIGLSIEKQNLKKNEQKSKEIIIPAKQRSKTVSEVEMKNQQVALPMKRSSNTPNLSIPTFSKRETTFEKILQRDIEQAKTTVNEVNNHFGPIIFSQVHKNQTKDDFHNTFSDNHMFKPIEKAKKVKQSEKEVSRFSEPLRKRRSYQEMLNILDDDMFNTDSDEIDLSFDKDTLQTKIDFEIKPKIIDTRINHSSESDHEHVYHVTISKKALDDKQLKTPSIEIRRPSYAPPAPPTIVIDTVLNNPVLSIDNTFRPNETHKEKIKQPFRDEQNSDSLTYSSSDVDDHSVYVNVLEKQSLKQQKKQEIRAEREREINRLIDISIQKYINPETPPPFSPPITIPQPKFSVGLNVNSEKQSDPVNMPEPNKPRGVEIPSKNYPVNDISLYKNVPSAKVVANQLFTKRGERSNRDSLQENVHNLPIKNIKSLRLKEDFQPPAPKFPPSCSDPFNKGYLEENQYANMAPQESRSQIKYSPTENEITTNYNFQNRVEYFDEDLLPPVQAQLYRSESIDYYSLQQPSPQLLKAEIVEKKQKTQPEVQLKREYLGPYGVSFMQDQDISDSKKHAVTFYLPPEYDDPIYANNEADFTILPPKLPPKPQNTDQILSPSRITESKSLHIQDHQQYFYGNKKDSHLLSDNNEDMVRNPNKSLETTKHTPMIERHIVAIKEGTSSLSRASLTDFSSNTSNNNEDNIQIVAKDNTQSTPEIKNTLNNENSWYYSNTVHTFPKSKFPLKSILRNSNRNIVPEKNSIISPRQAKLVSTPAVTHSFNQSSEALKKEILKSSSPDTNKPPALPKTPPPPPRLQKEEKQKFFGSLLKEEHKTKSHDNKAELKAISNNRTIPDQKIPSNQSNLYIEPYGMDHVGIVDSRSPYRNRPHSAQGRYSFETRKHTTPQQRPFSQQGYNYNEKSQIPQSYQTYSNITEKSSQNKQVFSSKERYPEPEAFYSNVQDDKQTYQQPQRNQNWYDGQSYQNKNQSALQQQPRQEPYKSSTERARPKPYVEQQSFPPYQYLHHTQVHPYSPQDLSLEDHFESLDSVSSLNRSYESHRMMGVPHLISEDDATYQNLQGLKTDV